MQHKMLNYAGQVDFEKREKVKINCNEYFLSPTQIFAGGRGRCLSTLGWACSVNSISLLYWVPFFDPLGGLSLFFIFDPERLDKTKRIN